MAFAYSWFFLEFTNTTSQTLVATVTPKNTTDDIDYIRTVDDDGPIVNHIETTCQGNINTPDWESSDWFILNNYNTFIDKYVYKYDEVKRRSNNNMGITNEEQARIMYMNFINNQ